MNESEKERLIKKDIESIENRVRHAFNQGYEMGVKVSRSENPNTCGDAISREELIEALDTWDKFGYAPTNELIPLRGSADKDKYVPYIHYDDVIECIKGMPSVSPRPTQSDDAISRQAVLNAMYELCDTGETLKENPWRDNPHIDGVVEAIEELTSVKPQQRTGRRTGRWERMSDLPNDVDDRFKCSRCGNIVHYNNVMNLRTFSRWCGRCGSYNG